jgi:hypothetical protein
MTAATTRALSRAMTIDTAANSEKIRVKVDLGACQVPRCVSGATKSGYYGCSQPETPQRCTDTA